MAQQFNLTAQINLQSPKNVGKVVSDIQRQLRGSGLNTVNIKVKADARSMAQTNKQLQNVSKNSRAAAKDINTLNRSLQEATRRFSVITLATGSLLSFVTGFKNATKAAIEFERELIKISQVTGKSLQQLQGLTKEVTRLSTAFGVSSADLLSVSRTLAQAGFNAEKTRKSLDILAKTTLAATFDNIQDTTEGAIALLRQFGNEAKRTGGDVAFLEKSLSAINSVSKKFAVESGDLITVIRRVGGVFSSAGGSVNELIALFTSVRATTRESAETIATGLRTIFTRIQRVETINQLKALNIQLQDSQGQFVGAFEAVKRLSQGLAALNPKDFRFNQIVEQLGGFRQIGKVIPLIQQFDTAQRALTVAQASSGSVAKDAATAQQGLGVQIQKVREEFTALIRKFTDSGPFNTIATGALKIASAMIKVAEAVEPLLPLLTTMFGLKLGRALAPGLGQLAGIGRGSRGGGGFSKFARGGMVPGSGNRDTVPAMLTPGEFVIKKSSVKKLGSGTLSQMNKNGYATGGIVALKPYDDGPANPTSTTGKFTFGDVLSKTGLDINTAKSTILDAGKRGTITDPILKSFVKGTGKNAKLSPINKSVSVDVHGAAIGDATVGDRTEKLIRDDFRKSVNSNGGAIAGFFGASVKKQISDSDLNNLGITGVIGNAFEAILGSLGVPFDKASDVKESNESAFDFPRGVGSQIASKLKVNALASQPTDAKRTLTSKYLNEVYSKKYPNLIADEVKTLRKISIKDNIQKNEKRIQQAYLKSSSGVTQGDRDVGRILGVSQSQVAKFRKQGVITAPSTRNKGGGISGSDTVPAMLTPGEFVFNKGAAQSIGYGNLNRMNKQGVQGFADGGAVGVQHFEDGGEARPSRFAAGIQRVDRAASAAQSFVFLGASVGAVTAQMSGLEESTKKAINQTVAFAAGFVGITATLINTITSMIGANITEVVASEAVTTAKTAEAGISVIARGAMTGFVAGIGAAVLAATYMSAKLTAEADALARGFQEALAKLKAGEGNVGQLQDVAKQQIETRNRAQDFTVNPFGSRGGRGAGNLAGAAAGAGGGAVLGAKAGAAIGTVIAPGVGTAIGAAIGGIGGGVGGGLLGFFGVNALQGESGLSSEANTNIETINRTVASLDGLYDSTRRINEVTKQINEAPGLSSDEKITRQLGAVKGGSSAVTEAQAANDALSALAERVGVGVQQLTKENLNAFDDTGSALQAYEILQTQLAAATENVNAKLQITASALGEAISAQVGSTKTFEELLSDGGTFAKAFNARKEAIEQSNEIEINAATRRVQDLESAQKKAVKGSEEEAKIKKDLKSAIDDEASVRKESKQRLKDLTTSTTNVVEAQRENVIQLREAREAQRALNAELLKTSQATAVFKERARLAKEEGDAIGNFIDVINNKTVKAKALGVTEIDNITDIFDFERFAKEVRSTSAKGGKAASEIGESLIANATLLQDAQDKLVKQDFENLGEGFTVADILEKELGLTANTTPGGRRVFDKIVESLDKSIKTGGNLSAQVIAEAFAPFVDVMEGQAGVLKAITESEQAELDKRSRQLDAVDALRQKELDVRKGLVDATISGLDALNKANNILAKSIDPESQAGSVSGLQVAAQQALAQRNLDTVGLGLQAGNVDQIVKARQRALVDLKNLDRNEVEARRDQERIIKATTTELERLADGSAEINAVTEAMDRNLQAIEKERRAREQVTGVIEDFVVGGVEARRGLVEAASGVRQAFTTGTLQLQTPEQRSSTVGLLDRLSDVKVAGGMTGKQIKQELVFRDAIKLGLDPQLAEAIALGSSTEEKLIEANKQLTLSILVLASTMQDAASGLAIPDAITAASGGMVQYRAGGGSIFKPKGTDTVPAMLSPGEFVIRKSAVDAIGADNLAAMNSGASYFHEGGGVPKHKHPHEKEQQKTGQAFNPTYRGGVPGSPTVAFLGVAADDIIAGRTRGKSLTERLFQGTGNANKFAKAGVRPKTRPASPEGRYGFIEEFGEGDRSDQNDTLDMLSQDFNLDGFQDLDKVLAKEFKREQIADESNLSERAIAAGYKPSFKGTSQQTTDDPIPNPTLKPKNADETLSQGVSGPKEFLDRKAQQAKDEAGYRKTQQFNKDKADFSAMELSVISRMGTDRQKLDAGLITQEEIDSRKPDSTSEFQQYQQTAGLDTRVSTEVTGTDFSPIDSVQSEQSVAERRKNQQQAEEKERKALQQAQTNYYKAQAAKERAGISNEYAPRTLESFGPSRGQLTQTDTDVQSNLPIDQRVTKDAIRDDRSSFAKAPVTPSAGGGKRDLIGIKSDGTKVYADEPQESFNIPGYIKNVETGLYEKIETGIDTAMETDMPMFNMRGVNPADFAAYNNQEAGLAAGERNQAILEAERREGVPGSESQLARGVDKYGGHGSAASEFIMTGKKPQPSSYSIEETDTHTKATRTSKDRTKKTTVSGKVLTGKGAAVSAKEAQKRSQQEEVKVKRAEKKAQNGNPLLDQFGAGTAAGDEMKKQAGESLEEFTARQTRENEFMKSIGMEPGRPTSVTTGFTASGEALSVEDYGLPEGRGILDMNPYTMAVTASEADKKAALKERRDKRRADIRARRGILPRGQRGTPAQLARRQQEEGAELDPNNPVNKARYERILRTNGPAAAKRFASHSGYEPPTSRFTGRSRSQQSGGSNTDQLLQQLIQQMLNKGRQQRPEGFASGGSAGGSDVIPAMLTPGEFVMSAGAVRQHGVGAMRSLNKGRVPGFNRGGMVGGVAYRHNGSDGAESGGGGISINTESLDTSFTNFVGTFSKELDKITGVFSPMASALQNLAKIFGGSEGIKMNHVHTVTIAAGSADSKLDAQTIDQIGRLAADYVKPLLPDGNDFNVA